MYNFLTQLIISLISVLVVSKITLKEHFYKSTKILLHSYSLKVSWKNSLTQNFGITGRYNNGIV